jgi:hypothetical protein
MRNGKTQNQLRIESTILLNIDTKLSKDRVPPQLTGVRLLVEFPHSARLKLSRMAKQIYMTEQQGSKKRYALEISPILGDRASGKTTPQVNPSSSA